MMLSPALIEAISLLLVVGLLAFLLVHVVLRGSQIDSSRKAVAQAQVEAEKFDAGFLLLLHGMSLMSAMTVLEAEGFRLNDLTESPDKHRRYKYWRRIGSNQKLITIDIEGYLGWNVEFVEMRSPSFGHGNDCFAFTSHYKTLDTGFAVDIVGDIRKRTGTYVTPDGVKFMLHLETLNPSLRELDTADDEQWFFKMQVGTAFASV